QARETEYECRHCRTAAGDDAAPAGTGPSPLVVEKVLLPAADQAPGRLHRGDRGPADGLAAAQFVQDPERVPARLGLVAAGKLAGVQLRGRLGHRGLRHECAQLDTGYCAVTVPA